MNTNAIDDARVRFAIRKMEVMKSKTKAIINCTAAGEPEVLLDTPTPITPATRLTTINSIARYQWAAFPLNTITENKPMEATTYLV